MRNSSNKSQTEDDATIKVLAFSKKEGWFVFTEYELPESILKKHGKQVSEMQPDIFPIFKGLLVQKARDIFGI